MELPENLQDVLDRKAEFIGGVLVDYGMGGSMDRVIPPPQDGFRTTIQDIRMRPNGESRFFEVVGEKFTCGADVGHLSIVKSHFVPGDWFVSFRGFGGHPFVICGVQDRKAS